MTQRLSHCFSRTRVLLVGCLAMAVTLSATRSAPAADEPRVTIIAIEGATTTYQSIDRDGKVVTVQVPSQSIADIRGADAQGNVQATVTAIDLTTQQVTVQTSAGQTIVLALPPAAVQSLQLGAPFLFTVPVSRRPEPGGR